MYRLGFAPILYFNCEHFVYIVKQNKKLRGFHKKISWISKFDKNRILFETNF